MNKLMYRFAITRKKKKKKKKKKKRNRPVFRHGMPLQGIPRNYCMKIIVTFYTVEPVYNGPVLSGDPLLSGQFLKSQFFAHTNAVFVTCIRRPPLLSGGGHPVAVLCLSFFVIFTCIKQPPLNGN